jgi:16S rRNA (cytosine967-C5)-methyltransferase
MLHSLTKMGIEIGTHPFMEQAVYIKGSKNCDLSQLRGAEAQDLASQCVGMCCNPKPGEQWWDMCAGAGGKSIHLAELMNDKGLILATDIRASILDQFSKRLNRNKYSSIKMALWNGAADRSASAAPQAPRADPAPDKYFDGVLVDAPCSGMGTWHRNPDARWRISIEQIRNYADIQANLLQIAATKVKPGGKLVYSTCTLTKSENMEVITAFLEQNGEFRLEKLINPLNREPANGIIWIWPYGLNCNGMFMAVMKKD